MRVRQTDNQAKKEKLDQIKELLEGYYVSPEWTAYKRMEGLSKPELMVIREQWDKYYRDLKETTAYKRFFQMKELWKTKDFSEVKKLALEAKLDREQSRVELRKPSSYDPDWLKDCWIVKRTLELEKLLVKHSQKDAGDFMAELMGP